MYSAFQLTIIHGQRVHAMLTPAVTMQEPGTPLVVISFSPGPYSPATPCFHMPQRPCTPSRDSLPAEPRTAVTRRGCGGWDPYAELLAYGMAMAYAARGRALRVTGCGWAGHVCIITAEVRRPWPPASPSFTMQAHRCARAQYIDLQACDIMGIFILHRKT